MRFVQVYDTDNDTVVGFVFNNSEVSAMDISNLYSHRWNIEVFHHRSRYSDHNICFGACRITATHN